MPAMQRKNFYFDAQTDERLYRLAEIYETSRAGVLRLLVDCEFERLGEDPTVNRLCAATAAPYRPERKEALG